MVTTIAMAMAMAMGMPVAKAKAKILATGRKGHALYFGKTNFRQYSKIRASNYGYGRGWAKLALLRLSLAEDKLGGGLLSGVMKALFSSLLNFRGLSLKH